MNSPKGQSVDQQYHQQQQHQQPAYNLEDPELTKIVINQLSILITTATGETLDSHYSQIRFILDKQAHNPIVLNNYYEKLVNFIRLQSPDSLQLLPVERLFQKELDHVARDLNYLELLFLHLTKLFHADFDIIAFVTKFEVDLILSFIILINFQSLNFDSAKKFIQDNAFKLASHFH